MIDLAPLNRHRGRVALSFSGGKDSTACVYLLRDRLDEITLYWVNTGDLLPETLAVVAEVRRMAPHFVEVRTDARGWIAQHGLPSDLLPHASHWIGAAMGEGRVPLLPRYACCQANLMLPLYQRVQEDGCTLLIRGTKRVDMARLPMESGEVSADGIELWLPLQEWSHAAVFQYLRDEGAPLSPVYDHVTNSPECARCPAWWGEKRASYLKEHHPELHRDYTRHLIQIAAEISGPLANLKAELEA